MISILLVDDHHLVIDGMRAMLADEAGVQVVGHAHNGLEALERALELQPDVVIMDISMPGMDGIEATRSIRKEKKLKGTQVLALSMYNNREFIEELLAAGAAGYLLKNTSRSELREALFLVAEGRRYICASAQEALDAPYRKRVYDETQTPVSITKREQEIIRMIVADMSSQQIADALHRSISTIETHRKNIMQKLDVHSTAGLVRYAMERGWGNDQ